MLPYVGDTTTSQTSHGIFAPRRPDKFFMMVYHPEPSAEEPNPNPEGIELCVINAFSAYGAESIFMKELMEIVEVEDPDTINTEENDDKPAPTSFYTGGTGVQLAEQPEEAAGKESEEDSATDTDDA